MTRLAWRGTLLISMLAGCVRGEPASLSQAPSDPIAESSSPPAPAPVRSLDAPECSGDQQCLLLPWVTCCGECPPVHPFDVGPVEELDAILIESEERCAKDTRPCNSSPACDATPATCTARAVCVDSTCGVIEDGCGPAII